MITNPIKGDSVLVFHGGNRLVFRLDWSALAVIETEYGDLPFDLQKIDVLVKVGNIALQKHHPDMTEERLREISPPTIPTITALQAAFRFAHYGIEPLPTLDEDAKKNRLHRVKAWFRKRFAPLPA